MDGVGGNIDSSVGLEDGNMGISPSELIGRVMVKVSVVSVREDSSSSGEEVSSSKSGRLTFSLVLDV